MSRSYREPCLIAGHHIVDDFVCQSAEQTQWLREHAGQAHSVGTTKVFVVTEHHSDVVIAYYAWCMSSIDIEDAPKRLRAGAGRYPQPVALLARLGVDLRHEHNGLGAGLLQNAICRLVSIDQEIGCRGLLIHAEDAHAKAFYLHVLPDLDESPTDELHLVLLMKDARRTLLGE